MTANGRGMGAGRGIEERKKKRKTSPADLRQFFFQRPVAITTPENLTQIFIIFFSENVLTPGFDVWSASQAYLFKGDFPLYH